MTKQKIAFFFFIVSSHTLFAQPEYGGRLTAMGNNGAAVEDIWGTAANPASIRGIKTTAIHINYKNHLITQEWNSAAIAVVIPNNHYIFGLNIQREGIREFYVLRTALMVAKNFGPRLSIGIRAKHHQITIATYGGTSAISLDLGILNQFSEKFTVGLYLNNPSKEVYNTTINIEIPSIIHLGIAYKTSDKLLFATTLIKEYKGFFDVAIGIDYRLIKVFSLRSGISLSPFKQYAGVGFNSSSLLIDAAFTKHPDLGYSPQITIGYAF